jgi:hypothetical protein
MKPPRHITGELFLRGPIPWQWLAAAGRLGGKALHVGIYVWYLAGLRNSTQVKLSTRGLQEIGVTRKCAHEALAALERQQLLLVERRPGSCPVVVLILRSEQSPALATQMQVPHFMTPA